MTNHSSESAEMGAADEAPRYPHDCTRCEFLGSFVNDYQGGDAMRYDLYYHPAPSETVIARYGFGPHYYSGLHFAKPYVDISGTAHLGIPMLVEALRRANERGIVAAPSQSEAA